jgi:ketosteroid isomerase-like protein
MLKILLLVTLLALSGAAIAAAATPSRDERAIAAIENEMASAQSADGVTRTWDDNVVWYDIPAEVVGNKAATARLAHQFAAISNVRTKILRMTVHANGNIGYAYSTQNFISNVKSGGPELNFIFRETDIFVKKNGKWRLVHQHLSVPVDLASGRALINSKDISPITSVSKQRSSPH